MTNIDQKEIDLKARLINEFEFFVRYFFKHQFGRKFIMTPHFYSIIDALVSVVKGDIKRLIINIPPRYGKTAVAVKMFVAWVLANNPSAKFIHLSFSDDLALDNSSEIRELVKSDEYQRIFGVAIRTDSDSKKKWYTLSGGGLYATSTGGPITGFGAGAKTRERAGTNSPCDGFEGCIILDDPLKPDDAFSETMRNRINTRFNNTIASRVNSPTTPIIVIMQRLHESDMTGFLLEGGSGEDWHHVCLAAIKPDGTALWPEMHSIEKLRSMEQADPYTFAGQYMQIPSPLAGGIMKPDNITIIPALPMGIVEFVRGWDFAASTKGDFTAGAKLGVLPDGRWVIADMVRIRVSPDERDAALVNTANRDGDNCRISIPQDPGQAGLTQVKYLVRSLSGFSVKATPESGNKVVRAEPFAAQVNVGNVLMLKADWNDALISEMRMFPNGTFDDQVDALSRAFSMVITNEPAQIFIPDVGKPINPLQARLLKEMPGLPNSVIDAIQIPSGMFCGNCSAYVAGQCADRGFLVGERDVGCDSFINK